MPFTIPDKGEGAANRQSIFFQEDLEVLVAGITREALVLFGAAVTPSSGLTLAVSKGAVVSQGVMRAYAGGTIAVGTADGTNPRIDYVAINASGTLVVRAGTPAASPFPPTRTAGDVVLAAVYVAAGDTTIGSSEIVDRRVLQDSGVVIHKETTAVTVNNTSAAIEILNNGGSGLTIPNGLLTAGRILRVRLGGNWLANSGTPTLRIAIAFGGTTMFSDLSGASTADTDRAAWFLDFLIVAQGTSDQALIGTLAMGQIAAKTAPTTGISDAWSTAQNIAPVAGASAVDADAANRVLSVQLTFSVANAANEVVVEGATVELL